MCWNGVRQFLLFCARATSRRASPLLAWMRRTPTAPKSRPKPTNPTPAPRRLPRRKPFMIRSVIRELGTAPKIRVPGHWTSSHARPRWNVKVRLNAAEFLRMRFNGALLRRFFYPQKYNLPCHIMARQDVNLRFKKIQLLIMKNGFFLAITLSFNYFA